MSTKRIKKSVDATPVDATAWRRLPFSIALGAGTQWQNHGPLTVDDHFQPAPRPTGYAAFFPKWTPRLFSGFEVSDEKDGWGVAPPLYAADRGPVQRLDGAVLEKGVTFRDYDQGIDGDTLCQALDSTGLAYVLWPTFSHLKSSVKFAASTLDDRDPVASARDVLRAKGAPPHVVDSLANPRTILVPFEFAGKVTQSPFIVLETCPIPKWRAAFFHSTAWQVMPPGLSRVDAIRWAKSPEFGARKEEHAAKCRGLDSLIGIPSDPALNRLAQFTYPPRRPTGSDPADFFFHVRDGACLDFDSLSCVEGPKRTTTRKASTRNATTRSRCGEAEGRDATAGEFVPRTRGLFRFLKVSRTFDVHAFCQAYAVPGYRVTRDGKGSCPCPLAHEHGDGGAVDLGGFWFRNGDAKSSWVMRCEHTSGASHLEGVKDRARFLDALCVELGIKDARELYCFCVDTVSAPTCEE